MRIHSVAIRYFDAVRQAGSIREASRRLNVASSAVNRQILNMEAEIGAPLFERLPGRLKLTAAGEAMARHVLNVLQDLERVGDDLERLRGGTAGHITVATVEGVCGAVLPDAIGALRRRAPAITLGVTIMGSLDIPRAVEQGDADVGVAFVVPTTSGLKQIDTARFRLGAIMTPDHVLAGKASVQLAQCLDHPIIMAGPGLSISHLLSPLLLQLNRPMAAVVTANSIELMRELAERGEGLAFQTRLGIERLLASGRLAHVPLDANGPVWSLLSVSVRAGRLLPASLEAFLTCLLAVIHEREAVEAQIFA
jgi:DNA-binding transcriptional LysR family regulator